MRIYFSLVFCFFVFGEAFAADQDAPFRLCVKKEAKLAFARTIAKQGEALSLYGYHTEIVNQVLATCGAGRRQSASADDVRLVGRIVEQIAADKRTEHAAKEDSARRRQAELDAPRIAAEKEREHSAGISYATCLRGHAQMLALASTESANVVVDAVFASCLEDRGRLEDAEKQLTHYSDVTEFMNAFDGAVRWNVILEIIGARARAGSVPQKQSPASATSKRTPL